jgi:hypothetical protein
LYRFPEINPVGEGEDVFDLDRLEKIHQVVQRWESKTVFDHDSSFADEVQPIRISKWAYKKLFNSAERTDEVWFISILKTFRSQ